MHDAPGLGIEGIAPMQHAEIVPHENVAHLPAMAHGKARLGRMRPQRIEQAFALGQVKAEHICIRTPAEEESLAAGPWLGANERMMRANSLADVGDLFVSLAQHAGTVARGIMNRNL